jgi:hypothetical protein
MAQWQRKLKLKDVWNQVNEGRMTVQELAGVVVQRLGELEDFGDEYVDDRKQEVLEMFESVAQIHDADVDDFDCAMENLYDWADMRLDNRWNGKAVCWVETF